MADKKIVLKNVEVSWAKLQEAAPKYMSEETEFTMVLGSYRLVWTKRHVMVGNVTVKYTIRMVTLLKI